jgi:hypothetical protein
MSRLIFQRLLYNIQHALQDFVKMISQELSASPDFALPEHFWRIAREEDAGNGKFFSRIERVLWQDM